MLGYSLHRYDLFSYSNDFTLLSCGIQVEDEFLNCVVNRRSTMGVLFLIYVFSPQSDFEWIYIHYINMKCNHLKTTHSCCCGYQQVVARPPALPNKLIILGTWMGWDGGKWVVDNPGTIAHKNFNSTAQIACLPRRTLNLNESSPLSYSDAAIPTKTGKAFAQYEWHSYLI